jgi:hypothetical protein
MLSKPNEVIVWRDAEHELPDEEIVVLLFAPGASEPVWGGYLIHGLWVWASGHPIVEPVVAWAEMPAGPGKNGETEE